MLCGDIGGDVMSIPPINQTRMEHESVHFSCVKEDPEFVVQWYKDGVPLDDLPFLSGRFLVTPEGSLDIYDAALNDNGFYSCRIISAKGTLSAGAFLNVQCKCIKYNLLIKSIFDVPSNNLQA